MRLIMINGKIVKKGVLCFVFLILGVLLYSYCPYKIEGIGYYDKIWAHRVNSLEKLDSALDYFDGIELDLIYDLETDILDVNHTVGESIGLSFKTYLNAIDVSNGYPYLWLDIKKLDLNNGDQILKKLLELFHEKSYPLNKVLIETRHPEVLPKFKQAGFKTSYYLPVRMYLKDSVALEKSLKDIRGVLEKQPDVSISTDYRDYEIIKKHFPNRNKYIWAILRWTHLEHKKVRAILKDEKVEILLLNYKAIEGNR